MQIEEQRLGKEELRAKYKEFRESLEESTRWEIDGSIANRFFELPAYQHAELILVYLSMGLEVETRGIIQRAWKDGKTVALPRCVPGTRKMEWYPVSSLDGLVESPFGIWEPARNEETMIDPYHMRHALCVVPGLAFDEIGYRIGYGGGFYDVFLEDFLGISVGLCRSGSICRQSLRLDSFDLPVDLVVTEDKVYGIWGFGSE